MMKRHTSGLLLAALLACGACSNVRQAPVETRQEIDPPAQRPADSAAGPVAGERVEDEDYGQWAELPGPPGSAETGAPAPTGPVSDNPAVIALLEDTDLSISQDDPEAAAGSVERALRLEPENPWLWHRLALLKLEQGNWRLAIALAQKSHSLSARRPALRTANADLISRARKQQQGNIGSR